MALLTESYLRGRVGATNFSNEASVREIAAKALLTEKRAASATQTYDIFLSHASEDAIIIKALRDELVAAGYTVYVDWIDDPQLDREHVTKVTAAVLRSRMRQCKSLLFATSNAARKSVWMPWELGYMDAHTLSRVAIVPVVKDSEADGEFKGQEYLGLYPYLDKTNASFFIQDDRKHWVNFSRWLRERANPEPH
jgi:hypothetical protein